MIKVDTDKIPRHLGRVYVFLPQGLPTSRFALREARSANKFALSRRHPPHRERRRTRRRGRRNEDHEARSANNFAPSWEPS
eukprot:3409939-Pyramimonas_sp.AAC.1